MRKQALLWTFQQRLAQLCCSASRCRRSTREIADHFDDLKAGALEEGMSEAQAEERAAERLGDPRALAERLAAALRQSSWWGRHPLIGLCLLPSVGALLLMIFVTIMILAGMKEFLPAAKWEALAAGGAGYNASITMLHTACYVSFLVLMIFVCRLAHRTAVGLKWTLTACFLSSLQAAFRFVSFRSHYLSFGYSWSWITGTHMPDFAQWNWAGAAIPLLCAAVVIARRRRVARSLALTDQRELAAGPSS
jgi:hypothetical protein